MNLHEYQAKQLFRENGITVPKGGVCWNADEAVAVAKEIGGQRWVIKAQIHAGGRGKAGGVKIVSNLEDIRQTVQGMLGIHLVTFQTDERGQPIHQVLVEEPSAIKRELYLSAVIDRSSRRIVVIASTEGGMDIEEVAKKSPDKILKIVIDPLLGILPYQTRQLAFNLQLDSNQSKQLSQLLFSLVKLFVNYDLSLLEINPLVITEEGQLVCLDGKINVDENALYRQPTLRALRDPSQEDARENRARDWELNYIALEGDIGCMVNGAGLAMATMDLIKLHGGSPANFLDVGGGATKERVTEAFKIILSDEKVKGVLINIFGGIVRCDMIAEGIISAVASVGIALPVVVRLEGNQAEAALQLLRDSGLNIIPATGFNDAAIKIVKATRGEA